MKTFYFTWWKVAALRKLFVKSRTILRKTFSSESDKNKLAPRKLLKSLSVIGVLLEVFEELDKNKFQFKKHLWGIISQAPKRRKYICGGSVNFSSLGF